MVEKTHTSGFWPGLVDPLRQFGQRIADWVAPPAEASASDAVYRIAVELPGVGEDEVEVSYDDGVLTVRGEKTTARDETGETWFFSERQYGAFTRSFRLPPDAEGERIAAAMKSGVLTITVPKRLASETKARKVEISHG